MRLIDRYLLRELMIPLGYCLGGFLLFWISFDLFTSLNEFQKASLSWGEIALFYALRAPELLVVILPVALLLALLYALTHHARHHELTAIRAAGSSLWRIALPYFGVGLSFAGLLYALNEEIVPDAAERCQELLARHASGPARKTGTGWTDLLVFENELDGRHWHIGRYHAKAALMVRPQIDWRMPDGSYRQIHAEAAAWEGNAWVFTNVEEIVYPPPPQNDIALPPLRTNQLVLADLAETPELIASEIKISNMDSIKAARQSQLNAAEITHYLALHPRLDIKRRDILLTQLHNRRAAPWTCLVVVLIALPFGAASGRRNVFVGVASSVFICFAFFVLRELALALGSGGYTPAWLAAWAPNVLFGGAGFILTQRVR